MTNKQLKGILSVLNYYAGKDRELERKELEMRGENDHMYWFRNGRRDGLLLSNDVMRGKQPENIDYWSQFEQHEAYRAGREAAYTGDEEE